MNFEEAQKELDKRDRRLRVWIICIAVFSVLTVIGLVSFTLGTIRQEIKRNHDSVSRTIQLNEIQLCVLTTTATTRTDADIKKCYAKYGLEQK